MVQKSNELLSVLIKKIYKLITYSDFYFIFGPSSNELIQKKRVTPVSCSSVVHLILFNCIT